MLFDAVLLLSFGGPEGPQEVRPFLENVTRGRGIPPERLDEVAEHYFHFGGVSPINGINRALVDQISRQLESAGHPLPVFFGNRNWHPMVEDTVAEMRDKGIRRAAVFTTSAWGGYSGCKQYVEDIAWPVQPSVTARRSWSNFVSTSTTRPWCSCTPRRCPPRCRACAVRRDWCSRLIRFPLRRTGATAPSSTAGKCITWRNWSPPRLVTRTTTWCGNRVRARLRFRGLSPILSITLRR